ncbi:hypothetical protein KC343_g12703 [Hortaea werneckii]|nr:hypothetical protein KC323_g7470 [Hortaea werneckii]KAI7347405.1 hypothetical protein KC320_g7270 [Hortaea werneckii]KAI7608452.1 hypothetical protein KC343_g12703 [Hortaea werneckii]KAI7618205.1 hypothetical protein KC346_g5118 [Hortaea werneckii]KAI7711651.1 hypothetical protein KC322_g4019 [Hortaea werneckii]
MANSSASPLLKLSPELRNWIYDEVLISERIVRLTDDMGKRTWSVPPLLQTCRWIRDEAMEMYYAQNSFLVGAVDVRDEEFPSDRETYDFTLALQEEVCRVMLARWLKALPDDARSSLKQIFISDHYHAEYEYREYDKHEDCYYTTYYVPSFKRYREMLKLAGAALPKGCLLYLEVKTTRYSAYNDREPFWSMDGHGDYDGELEPEEMFALFGRKRWDVEQEEELEEILKTPEPEGDEAEGDGTEGSEVEASKLEY